MPSPSSHRRTILDSRAGTVALGLVLTVLAALAARWAALGHP